jgi:DNA polymerase-1
VYKELEFYSLLRELGPSEDTRARDYQVLGSAEAVAAYLASIPAGTPVALAISAPREGELGLGAFGIARRAGEARTISFSLLDSLKPLLEDASRPKIVCDSKSTTLALSHMGVEVAGLSHDIMLYAFLLDADPSAGSLDEQARRRLDIRMGPAPEQQADLTLEIWSHLNPAIDERSLRKLYDEIELPLAGVLARMERTGVLIDAGELARLSQMMEGEIARLTSEIHGLAGKSFNISSPQQLGKVLFQDLGLPAPVKYGKGKVISTAADVLDELAPNYEIVRKVLEYRQLTKLKGTYVDALPSLVDPGTRRLHTSFNQAGAATGRLSSSNPNLQNIPIKTELGREIRAAFVARPEWRIMVADYSQIELRLLAHMSHDPVLVDAFRRGEDIHTHTAAEVLGVPPLMVTPEARRQAKVINFGIVYGMSPFGLSQTLGISREEAEKYIQNYFLRYAGVRKFIDDTIAEVRRTGVARTLFGRERPIPDMNSRNPNSRGFAERTAVNTPLQGTAADLIKLAMIRIDHTLAAERMQSKMLLQVHDELVFEAAPGEEESLRSLVKREMEQASALDVPLLVEIGVGKNWRDAK